MVENVRKWARDLGPKSGKSGLMDRTKNNGEAYRLS